MKPRVLDPSLDDETSVSESPSGKPDSAAKQDEVGRALVAQLQVLETVPDALVGVQIGRVTGQQKY
jgi:hypothetical protein